ncbi:MAG: diaminopimelate epimerase [Leptonema sp. (in: bacteria)]
MDRSLEFFKMEGIGNDYIYFDFTNIFFSRENICKEEIPKLCDRRFGVGGDGVVVLTKSDRAEIKMLMWNSDGSESKICGNALRCVSYYWYRKENKNQFYIETEAGIHKSEILKDTYPDGLIKVNMGQPIFDKNLIPYLGDSFTENVYRFYDESILPYEGIVLSMGNPHCVFFVDSFDKIPIHKVGSLIENHRLFPQRTNVEFVKINPDSTLQQITWERGSGETLACGSGACAVLVASVLTKKLPTKNEIHLKGGILEIEWDQKENQVYMIGKASFVYKGELIKKFQLFDNL